MGAVAAVSQSRQMGFPRSNHQPVCTGTLNPFGFKKHPKVASSLLDALDGLGIPHTEGSTHVEVWALGATSSARMCSPFRRPEKTPGNGVKTGVGTWSTGTRPMCPSLISDTACRI